MNPAVLISSFYNGNRPLPTFHQRILFLLVHIAQLYPIRGPGDSAHARFVDAAEGVGLRLFVAMRSQNRIQAQPVINRIDIVCRTLKCPIDIHGLNMPGGINRID